MGGDKHPYLGHRNGGKVLSQILQADPKYACQGHTRTHPRTHTLTMQQCHTTGSRPRTVDPQEGLGQATVAPHLRRDQRHPVDVAAPWSTRWSSHSSAQSNFDCEGTTGGVTGNKKQHVSGWWGPLHPLACDRCAWGRGVWVGPGLITCLPHGLCRRTRRSSPTCSTSSTL